MRIYFLQPEGENIVKIGLMADKSVLRLTQLQCANPKRLILRALIPETTKKAEFRFHRRFSEYHIRGEWFRLGPLLEDCIAAIGPPPPGVWPRTPKGASMGRPKLMTDAVLDAAEKYLRAGKAPQWVADKLKVSRPSIYAYFRVKKRGSRIIVTRKER